MPLFMLRRYLPERRADACHAACRHADMHAAI